MRIVGTSSASLSALIAVMLLGACNRDDQQIKVYRVAKAPLEATPPPDAAMPTNASSPGPDSGKAPANAEKPAIKWDIPDGWSPSPTSPMRYASFAAEKNGERADISVVTFPGDGGSDADNVNRWRQQIGLPAVEPNSLDSLIVPLHAGEIHFSTVDMTGTNVRMLAGWTRHDGRAWFFKLTGPATLVDQEKMKFVAFLQSVRF
ncbi:MAG: hypothetical protein QOF24_659 [Verrucomicrobiota bacterium]|jgi:hypothetical protein